ncbi:MAG: hypothetical protein PF549_02765 [Patescibacteria group bacterium]|jgi:hypothetical protein|nr:hypothetical protein [Patescibacteria group bacterium]
MLSNRFPNKVFVAWMDWYSCFECGQNTADALHHIISPSNKYYIKGRHNKSVLNSALLCNFKCHLYNPELHKEYKTKEYLAKTFKIMSDNNYDFGKIDSEFLDIYKKLYE